MIRLRLIVIALLLGFVLPVGAQDTPEISDELQSQFDQLNTYTTTLRELDLIEPLIVEFPSRDAVRDYLMGSIDEQLTPEINAEYNAFYTALGFLPANADLRTIVLDLYGQQVAGYYDPETKTMNVILSSGNAPGDSLPLLEQIIYVHELVHTLQDQHFDLDSMMNQMIENDDSDAVMAMQAVVEGDASFVMNVFTAQRAQENPLGSMLSLLIGGAQAGNLTLPADTPAILAAELLFPYQTGAEFVQAVYEDGGWDAVDAIFDDLPVSTEQIIHPDKYFARELPIPVTLTDASAQLGTAWALASDGKLGEFYLRQYLAQGLDAATVETAATGWGGDWYQVYSAGEQVALLLQVTWDSADDAAEMADAWPEFALAMSEADTVTDGCATGDSMTYCFSTTTDSTLMSAAPTLELAMALMNSQSAE